MTRPGSLFVATLALSMWSASAMAEGDVLLAAQAHAAHAAQVVVAARVAGLLCPGVEVDEAAVRDLMDREGITDEDIMAPDRFGAADEAAARSFKASVEEDPRFCAKVLVELEGRLGLVRQRP